MTLGLVDRLLTARPPLPWSEWAIRPRALELLTAEIVAGRRRVVECGSGVSTIVLARLLAELEDGELHALEHDRGWARLVAARLEGEGLSQRARVLAAALGPHPLAPPGCSWYDEAALARLPGGVELLLVDGPPAGDPANERSRYPALPALAPWLAPGALVVLDDADRRGESWVLEAWEREAGIEFERRPDARVALGRLP